MKKLLQILSNTMYVFVGFIIFLSAIIIAVQFWKLSLFFFLPVSILVALSLLKTWEEWKTFFTKLKNAFTN